MTCATEIRRRRTLAGLTVTQLAQAAHCSISHLSDIERGQGNPSPPLLKRLADALGCTTADLAQLEEAS